MAMKSVRGRAPQNKGRSKRAKMGHVPFLEIDVTKITPSPENDQLYRPISLDDPSIRDLAYSIEQFGVQEPLVLTQDYFIVSGHRRFAAAQLARLNTVPCRFLDIRRADDLDGFVRLLREHNRQRDKTLDEILREQIVEADLNSAHQELVEYRRKKSSLDVQEIELGECTRRARISDAKRGFLDAALKIIGDNREFWPLSCRQVHYRLLTEPPLRHARKPASTYRNDNASYKDLCNLLTRARLTGDVPLDAIDDETRPIETWNVHANPRGFVQGELGNLFRGYWRNLQQSQPHHIEIVAEKLTVKSIIQDVAGRFCIPCTIGRGFSSLPPRIKMHERFRDSGKDRLVVLFVCDFDPEGEEIGMSFARSMRDDFGIDSITPMKVALTPEQVTCFKLPPGLKAKKGSSRRKKFVELHGEHVWELEALQPADLQQLLTDTIDSVLDVEAFNRELEKEKEDAVWLDAKRQRAIAALGAIGTDDQQ